VTEAHQVTMARFADYLRTAAAYHGPRRHLYWLHIILSWRWIRHRWPG
jgi:hypothetical protein